MGDVYSVPRMHHCSTVKSLNSTVVLPKRLAKPNCYKKNETISGRPVPQNHFLKHKLYREVCNYKSDPVEDDMLHSTTCTTDICIPIWWKSVL